MRSEYTLRTKIKFVQPEDATNIPVCPITTSHPVFNFTIGLRFRIQRASSSHESTIKYKRLDNNQVEVFKFTSGPSDRMVLVYDGHNLHCTGIKGDKYKQQCNKLPIDKLVPAIIYEIDFDPTNGKAPARTYGKLSKWERNKYTLETNYYDIVSSCVGRSQ